MKPIKFTSMGVNYTCFSCTTIEEVKQLLLENPIFEQIKIESAMKSYGLFDYRIVSESRVNHNCSVTIDFLSGKNEQIKIEFPIDVLSGIDVFNNTQRSVDTSTELHYFGGYSMQTIGKLRVPFFVWKFNNVTMSYKYSYLLCHEGIKTIIDYLKK